MILKTVGKFLMKHKNVILGAVGIVGVIATGVTAAKAGYKYASDEKDGKFEDMDRLDKVKEAAKTAAPAVASAAVTITTIVATHKVHAKEIAALGAAYTALQSKYGSLQGAVESIEDKEVVKKVKEKFGLDQANKIKTEKAKEKKSDDGTVDDKKPYWTDTSDASDFWRPDYDGLYIDPISGRMFGSSRAILAEAANEFNTDMIHNFYAGTINDWYGFIDSKVLTDTEAGYLLGWDVSVNGPLEYDIIESNNWACLSNGRKVPVYQISFANGPIFVGNTYC